MVSNCLNRLKVTKPDKLDRFIRLAGFSKRRFFLLKKKGKKRRKATCLTLWSKQKKRNRSIAVLLTWNREGWMELHPLPSHPTLSPLSSHALQPTVIITSRSWTKHYFHIGIAAATFFHRQFFHKIQLWQQW